ncbi:MAG: glycosyltransferase family 4 protein [Oligoflexales bacterium]
MNLLIFTENDHCGGLDSFIVNLVNNWPGHVTEDTITIICNNNHPGLEVINSRVNKSCKIIPHKLPILSRWTREKRKSSSPLGSILVKVQSIFLKYLFMIYQVRHLRRIFIQGGWTHLIVVNGGYPAGDSCRSASIAWKIANKEKPSIHNFHNMAIKPRSILLVPEMIVDNLVVWASKQIVTVSKVCSESMSNRSQIWKKLRPIYIYNGIEPRFRSTGPEKTNILKKRLNLPDSSQICLMLGVYEERKGHRFLFEAFKTVAKKVPNAKLVICGHGYPDEINKVEQLKIKMGLEKQVILLNFTDDVDGMIRSSDVLLVGSQEFESFGLTIVEAMANKIPVVATDVGGIPEVLMHGQGGFCCNRNDPEEFADKVIMLLKDEKSRKIIGDQGFECFNVKFTAKVMANKYYKQLTT